MAGPQRIALVIGNSAYENSSPLRNPVNDAALITRALRRRGFEIVGGASTAAIPTDNKAGMNLNALAMDMTFAQFVGKVQPGAIAVLYDAGHGVQVGDKNFLVPVDDTLDASKPDLGLIDIKKRMQTLAARVGPEGNVVLFLDACRDGPLSIAQKRLLLDLRERHEKEEALAGRTAAEGARNLNVSETRGRLGTFKLQREENWGRTFIGFATAPGDVAQDGKGGNSAFALAVDKHLAIRGLHIEDFFDRVARDVLAVVAADYKGTVQDPWSETNLNRNLFLHQRDMKPIFWMAFGGLLAGLFICFEIFKGGRIISPVPLPMWGLGLVLGIVMAIGTLYWGSGSLLKWGSGKLERDAFFALVGPGIGFALALAILQILPSIQATFSAAELTGERRIADGVYKGVTIAGGLLYLIGTFLVRREKNEPWPRSRLGRLNVAMTWLLPFIIVGVLLRLETYMAGATPEQTAIAMFAVLGGVIYAASIPLALRAQGGSFAQFGPFTGSITVGLLMAAFFAAYEMMVWKRGGSKEEAQILLVLLGTAWHGLLGAQIGYCLAYYIPDYRSPVR